MEFFVPILDSEGNFQFKSQLNDFYQQIENPMLSFAKTSDLKMLKQCFAHFLKYKDEMRLYYSIYANKVAMDMFEQYLKTIEGFVGTD